MKPARRNRSSNRRSLHTQRRRWLVAWALYYTFARDGHAGGQGIGKSRVGLMVVNLATNQPCSRVESGTRTLVMVVLGAIPFFGFLIEPLVAFGANDGRRLGDRLAGTQVIAVGDYTP